MSDPFSDIDNEVKIEKFKNLFQKYKKPAIILTFLILAISSVIFYVDYNKKEKNIRLSGYLIEIISIINIEDERAISELLKLSKLGHDGHEILSNLLLSKIYLKRQDFDQAVIHLSKIEINSKKLAPLKKLKDYLISVAHLGSNNQQEFQKSINQLLSYGGYWALLGHELRGHFLFAEGNYEGASKDFIKILNEQLSTPSMRQRSQEMLNNIKLNDKNNN